MHGHALWGPRLLPLHYACQVTHQMLPNTCCVVDNIILSLLSWLVPLVVEAAQIM